MKTQKSHSDILSGKFFGLILLIIFASSACKKSNNNNSDTGANNGGEATASFVIDGDIYENQQITINGVGNIRENGATYSSKWKYTSAVVGDRPKEGVDNKNRLGIYIDGNQTGTQTSGKPFADRDGVQDFVNFQLDLTNPDGEQITYGYDQTGEAETQTPGSITITKYEDVNGTVEGNFEGTLMNVINGELVHITKGHFKMQRNADAH